MTNKWVCANKRRHNEFLGSLGYCPAHGYEEITMNKKPTPKNKANVKNVRQKYTSRPHVAEFRFKALAKAEAAAKMFETLKHLGVIPQSSCIAVGPGPVVYVSGQGGKC